VMAEIEYVDERSWYQPCMARKDNSVINGEAQRRYATGYHAKHRAMSNEQGGFASSRNYIMYTFRTSTSLQASP
jgi:hypothetical protein